MKKLIPFLNVYLTGFGGYANGYVAIPKTHPFYKKHYEDINELIDVHGGLTYSEFSDNSPDDLEFLDDSKKLPQRMWVFGFDTKHLGDNPNNCNRDFCVAETLKLKKQLEKYAEKNNKAIQDKIK